MRTFILKGAINMIHKTKNGAVSWRKGTVKLTHKYLTIVFQIRYYRNYPAKMMLENHYKRYVELLELIESNN